MPLKKQPIPVNHFGDDSGAGISIERFSFDGLPDLGEWQQPERHDRHTFFLIESGEIVIEIDFEIQHIQAPAALYMHPDQVHRIIGFHHINAFALAVNNESLNGSHLQLLEELRPAGPSNLSPSQFELLSEAASLGIKIAQRQKDQWYTSLLIDYGNALIGIFIAQFMEINPVSGHATRSAQVTRAFRKALSQNFLRLKSPAAYAELLHLTPAYLNECVKNVTAEPVSQHIQQRVVLEAKRLLYHSDQSLKEIAAGLGYDDYAYFSRLFTKVAGIAPLAFRSKNRD